jgi:hypothetical protein
LVLMLCAVAHAGPISSDSADVSQALAQIAKLESSLEYEQALVLADRTIALGLASRDQLADLHLIAGRLAAGLDHADTAQAHFARVLALRPNTQLVAGTSPKLQTPFDAARAMGPTLEVELHADAAHAFATVARDPLALVTGMRATLVAGDGTRSTRVEHALELVVPIGQRVAALEAIDEHGNQLASAQFSIEPDHAAPPPVPPRTPIAKRWVTYTAISGVALVAGGLCAWRLGVAQDEWNRLDGEGGHAYSQLHAVEQRGQRFAIAADVSFGVAAIAGVVATVLFSTRESEPSHLAFTSNGVTFVARF